MCKRDDKKIQNFFQTDKKNLSTAQLRGSLLSLVLPNVTLFGTNFVSFN